MESETIQIVKPGPPSIVAELSPLVMEARAFEVTDVESDRLAQERGANCRRGEKAIEDHFKPMKDAAHRAHKLAVATVAALVGPISEARAIYFAKSDAFQAAERRRAEEETRRLQERARKEEEDRQLEAAIEAEARGETATSEAILQQPVEPPIVTVAPQIAKVEGVSSRTSYEPDILDARACIRYLLDRPEWDGIWARFIPVLVTVLRPFVTSQRGAFSVPGVRVVSKVVRATR